MQVKPVDRIGRPLGERGYDTKRSLLLALDWELEVTPWRALTVQQVAKRSGKKVGVFYQYFYSIEDAVLELADAVLEDDDILSDRMKAILHLIALGRE